MYVRAGLAVCLALGSSFNSAFFIFYIIFIEDFLLLFSYFWFLFCVILFYCVKIILREVYDYVVPDFLYAGTYSFQHKPTSMRVIAL